MNRHLPKKFFFSSGWHFKAAQTHPPVSPCLLCAPCILDQQINALAAPRVEWCLCVMMSAASATEIAVKFLQIKSGLVCTAAFSPCVLWHLMNFGQFQKMNGFTVLFTQCEALLGCPEPSSEMCRYWKEVARPWL